MKYEEGGNGFSEMTRRSVKKLKCPSALSVWPKSTNQKKYLKANGIVKAKLKVINRRNRKKAQ